MISATSSTGDDVPVQCSGSARSQGDPELNRQLRVRWGRALDRRVRWDGESHPGGINPYVYVYDNPVSDWDSTGLAPSGGPYHPPEGGI